MGFPVKVVGAAVTVIASITSLGAVAFAQTDRAPATFSAAQAQRGAAAYADNCAACHGDHLDDGQFAAPLKGPTFTAHFGSGGLDGPFNIMLTQMPPSNPGSLGAAVYADVLAYILSENGVDTSATDLPADADRLKGMATPR